MSSRWTSVAVLGLAAALLLAAAMSGRWLVADLQSLEVNGSLRIGLTSLKACVATAVGSQCERIEWAQLPGGTDGSMWMWLGRLTFAVCLAAALGLLALGGLAAADVEVRAPVPVPRLVLWLCLALLPFMFGYYMFPPAGLRQLEAGAGFALAGAGAVLGGFGCWRLLPDD